MWPFDRRTQLSVLIPQRLCEMLGEPDVAKASGDLVAIEKADKKVRLMLSARSSEAGLWDLSELDAYFDGYKGS
jgi:hypothetical protein